MQPHTPQKQGREVDTAAGVTRRRLVGKQPPPPQQPLGNFGDEAAVSGEKATDEVAVVKGEAKALEVIFLNCSVWGPMVEAFLKTPACQSAGVVGIGEHHAAAPAALTKIKKYAGRIQRRCFLSAAALPKGKRAPDERAGGTALIPKFPVRLGGVRTDRGEEPFAAGADWTAIVVKLKGVDLMMIQLYLTDSVGPKGVNLRKLGQIQKLICDNRRLPFIIFGDFNMTPAELQSSGFLRAVGAEVLLPDVEASCWTGRLLDFALVRSDFRRAVSQPQRLEEAPFKAHCVFKFEVARAPRALFCWCVCRPSARLADNSEAKQQAANYRAQGGKKLEDISSEERAGSQHQITHEQLEPGEIAWAKTFPVELGDTPLADTEAAAISLGRRFLTWSGSWEKSLAKEADVTNLEARRGRPPRLTMKPIVAPRTKLTITGVEKAELRWQNLQAALTDALRSRKRAKTTTQQNEKCSDTLRCIHAPAFRKEAEEAESPTEALHSYLWERRLLAIDTVKDSVLAGMLAEAGAQARRLGSRRAAWVRRSVRKWAKEATEAGASKAHAYLKDPAAAGAHDTIVMESDPGDKPEEEENDEARGALTFSPLATLESRRKRWSAFWADLTPLEKKRTKEVIHELRLHAFACETERPRITGKMLKAILFSLNPRRATGLDWWTVAELRALPDKALDELAAIIDDMERYLAAPLQAIFNLVSLIPKPDGGERPITLTSCVYVLWSAARTAPINSWEDGFAGFWDDAVRNSSCLQAALTRRLFDEVAVLNGEFVIGAYFDIEKFHDMVKIHLLARLALEHGFPIDLLVVDLCFHLGPRILKHNNHCSKPTVVWRSIVAGSKRSNTLARLILYPILHMLHYKFPGRVRQYVDDISLVVRGKLAKQVVNETVEISEILFNELTSSGFRVSSKTTLVSSHDTLARAAVLRLKGSGINVVSCRVARDLGVDASGGARRLLPTQAKRIEKASRKHKRVLALQRWSGATGRLYKPAIWAAGTYGVEAAGLSENDLAALRTARAQGLLCKDGQCPLTVLAVAGDKGFADDPLAAMAALVLKAWLALWAALPRDRPLLANAWQSVLAKPGAEQGLALNNVRGPLSTTIAVLQRLGWEPSAPHRWESIPTNTSFHFTGVGSQEVLLRHVRESVAKINFEKMAKHTSGSGAADGVDFTVPRKFFKELQVDEAKAGEATLALMVMAGAGWPMARRHAANNAISDICPRCGDHSETDTHRFWKCEANLFIKDGAVAATQHLAQQAAEDVENQVFWNRGLAPLSWLQVPPPPESDLLMVIGESEALDSDFPVIFTDASGGAFSADPRLRRVGFGIAVVRFDDFHNHSLHFGAFGALPGAEQTVPRGELYAAVVALRLLPAKKGRPVMLITDCLPFFETALDDKKLAKAISSANGDLWEEWQKMRRKHSNLILMQWTPSHQTAKELYCGLVNLFKFVGNTFADALAERGAALASVPQNFAKKVQRQDTLSRQVLQRNLAIMKEIVEDPELQYKKPRVPETSKGIEALPTKNRQRSAKKFGRQP